MYQRMTGNCGFSASHVTMANEVCLSFLQLNSSQIKICVCFPHSQRRAGVTTVRPSDVVKTFAYYCIFLLKILCSHNHTVLLIFSAQDKRVYLLCNYFHQIFNNYYCAWYEVDLWHRHIRPDCFVYFRSDQCVNPTGHPLSHMYYKSYNLQTRTMSP